MDKCSICGVVASHTLKPYTIGEGNVITADVEVKYCMEHALHTMQNNTTKVFKITKMAHVYPSLKIKLDGHSGGYIE